jgi:hypothetical protein
MAAMNEDTYVWLLWASAFLVPWLGLYIAVPRVRRRMLWASLFTTPFGLTEPLFVPEYWAPPSLFDLALRTGFDIESLIFCFGIGGVGSALYETVMRSDAAALTRHEPGAREHRYHRLALAAPFISFPLLYPFPWNPIYPAIVAMAIGIAATVACRPDLARRIWLGGALFIGYYGIFLLGLEWSAPGYIARVWDLDALSGVRLGPFPIEEFLFAAGFGGYWSAVYEHFTWRATVRSRGKGIDPVAGYRD